jgi:hypothetical protein
VLLEKLRASIYRVGGKNVCALASFKDVDAASIQKWLKAAAKT